MLDDVAGGGADAPPRGMADSVDGGGGPGVIGEVKPENGDVDGVEIGAAATLGCCPCAKAVVCQADVAAPVAADVIGGTGAGDASETTTGPVTGPVTGIACAVAELGTLAPGFKPVGTRSPSPASW